MAKFEVGQAVWSEPRKTQGVITEVESAAHDDYVRDSRVQTYSVLWDDRTQPEELVQESELEAI